MIEVESFNLFASFTKSETYIFNLFMTEMKDDNKVFITPWQRKQIRETMNVTDKTIWQSIKGLKKKDAIRELGRGTYMVNPSLSVKCERKKIPELIKYYQSILVKKSKPKLQAVK